MKAKSRDVTYDIKMTVDNVLYSRHFLTVDFEYSHFIPIHKLSYKMYNMLISLALIITLLCVYTSEYDVVSHNYM